MLKIRRPLGRLIFNMGIAIPGKTVFLIETAPWVFFRCYFCQCSSWNISLNEYGVPNPINYAEESIGFSSFSCLFCWWCCCFVLFSCGYAISFCWHMLAIPIFYRIVLHTSNYCSLAPSHRFVLCSVDSHSDSISPHVMSRCLNLHFFPPLILPMFTLKYFTKYMCSRFYHVLLSRGLSSLLLRFMSLVYLYARMLFCCKWGNIPTSVE